MAWQDEAKCADMDPDLFYPDKGSVKATEIAAALCRGCTVQEPCFRVALATPQCDDHGVRGGTTAKQRSHMRRRIGERLAGVA